MLGLVNNETQPQAQATSTPQPPKQEATGLDGYLEYLGIPRQEYANEPTGDIPDSNPFPDDTETEQPEDNTRANGFNPDNYYEPSEIKTIENNINFSMLPAESIVEVVDLGMVKGAELIAKEPQEGATDDEKEKLTKIWAMFLAGKNANISPGWMLLVMILLVYAPKFWGAWQIRKAKEEAEAQRIQAEKQRRRAEKAEAEAAELRRQAAQQDVQDQVRRAVMEAMRAKAQPQPQPQPEVEEVTVEDVEDVTADVEPVEVAEPKPKAKPKTKTTKK